MALNRIYITERAIAESMYRRKKERRFTTEDVMRLHWNRQGDAALAWARERIKRMRRDGTIKTVKPESINDAPNGDGRTVWYSFSEEKLTEWNLDQ